MSAILKKIFHTVLFLFLFYALLTRFFLCYGISCLVSRSQFPVRSAQWLSASNILQLLNCNFCPSCGSHLLCSFRAGFVAHEAVFSALPHHLRNYLALNISQILKSGTILMGNPVRCRNVLIPGRFTKTTGPF